MRLCWFLLPFALIAWWPLGVVWFIICIETGRRR